MNEQSVKSSPERFRWDSPRIHGMGSKGSLATTRPSKLKSNRIEIRATESIDEEIYMELNMPSKAMKVKLDANIDFIFTMDKSRLFTFNFSSCRSKTDEKKNSKCIAKKNSTNPVCVSALYPQLH